MSFSLLDDKQNCVLIIHNNREYLNSIPNNLKATWEYNPILENKCESFVSLYCDGKTLTDVCPIELKQDWKDIRNKLKAYQRSFKEAKVDLYNNCIFDLIPMFVLKEYAEIRNKIIEHVYTTYKKPSNYDFLLSAEKLLKKIENQPLNLLSKDYPTRIRYNLLGNKTSRLSLKSNSFPILNLSKEKRNIILPQNDLFLSLDYNSFEPRIMLYLLGYEQPKQDLYEWISNTVFNGLSRTEAKKRFFAWFYNAYAKDEDLEKIFNREKILNIFWKNDKIKTPFEREIECDFYHALNYFLQSTATDLFLRQVLKLEKLLDGKKSLISMLIHDNVVLDVVKEEKSLIQEIIDVFSNTEFGKLKVNIEIGKDFGNMERILI